MEHNGTLRQPRYTTAAAKESQKTLLSQQQRSVATKHRQVHQQSHQAGFFTGKLPLQKFCSFAPNTFNVSLLQARPNQRSSLQRSQQTKNETLRTAEFKYPHGRTLERASALFKRTFYPYSPLGSLSGLLISILR